MIRLPVAKGERIDVMPVVESLRPLIEASELSIETEARLPDELVDALYDSGVMMTLHPSELGGLELHPRDYLDLVFELSKIDASVGWIAVIQAGLQPLFPREDMEELRRRANGRWIVSGSHGRVGTARRVKGGYRFTGSWAFASGSPWADYVTGFANVVDDKGELVMDPETGYPQFIDGVFPTGEVEFTVGWNAMGLRGSGSGAFKVEDHFVEERFTSDGFSFSATYPDRPMFHIGWPGDAAVFLGTAAGALDAFIELAGHPPRADSWGDRTSRLGKDQANQIDVAHADAIIRAAREWVWAVTEKLYDSAMTGAPMAVYELQVQQMQSSTYAARAAKAAMNLVFDMAGTDSVIPGRGIERRFRDLHTATQHTTVIRTSYDVHGQYYLTRNQPGGPEMNTEFALLPPAPVDV